MSGVEEGDLVARVEGSAGIVRLNRPKAINAVTLEMFRDIDKALDRFEADPAVAVIVLEGAGERGLCAGGDIRALWESSKVNGDLGKILWREEYILNARIKKFPKPYVAFMDGIVMGGGVGLSAHARRFRVRAGDVEDAQRKIAARHGGDAQAAAARAHRVEPGRMPGARISGCAGSLPQRRLSRRRARRRDRQGPQSDLVAVANRGRHAGHACALSRRDRRRRIEVQLTTSFKRRKPRWPRSHSSVSATWAAPWPPIWSRPATRSSLSTSPRPPATRPRPTVPASQRALRAP